MSEWTGDPTEVRTEDMLRAGAVVVRFRRRRRATLALATFAGLAVASAQVVGGSTSVLRPLPPVGSPAPGTYVTPSMAPSPVTPPASVPAAPATGPDSGGGAGAPVSGAPGPTPSAAPRRPAAAPRPDVRRGLSNADPLECTPYTNWTSVTCATSSVTDEGDGTYLLSYRACPRNNVAQAMDLTFGTDKEVDFAVWLGDAVVWQWSTGPRFAAHQHTVTIGIRQCMVWTTPWSRTLLAGGTAAAGRYLLTASGFDTAHTLPQRVPTHFTVG